MSKDRIGKILSRSFYTRLDATVIARELLGKVIITTSEEGDAAGIIVETEAYMGPDDLACHAHSNRLTPRNKTMYEIGGTSYVYICYGMHNLFNAVTGNVGMGHAVLVRAVEPILNEKLMVSRRRKEKLSPVISNGPGKLSTALGIIKEWNGLDLTDPESPIIIVDRKLDGEFGEIDEGPRVGMSHHTKHCGHFPWRYKYSDNKWTSKPDKVIYDW